LLTAQTFAEKILARSAGLERVAPGQIVDVEPDIVLSHDNTAAIVRTFREIGAKRVKHPERLAVVLDHAAPAPTTQHARNHDEIRRFVAEQGIAHFFDVGRGICHQVLAEEGLALPGTAILGADSHTTHHGALGAFGAGVGRSEVAALWATGQLWLQVPQSLKIAVAGQASEWVTAKDLALYILGDLGADGALYRSVELHGPAIAAMTMAGRFVLSNMMAEAGAKNAYIAPDDVTATWLAAHANRPYEIIRPDPDAEYAAVRRYDFSAVEPQIACPHSPDNVTPLSQVAGTKVQQAFIGTCTNGRLEDLAAAAQVLAGRKVAPGTRLLVIPASARVMGEAMELGYLKAMLAAGAVICPPGCGPCMGNHLGIPAPGEAVISTANRNFRGRMGTPEAEIYLASPAVAAAAAVAGEIIHPADLGGGQ
jgi:3-isopropylmalate/(R)-2-methylmalate dehydratase large subunit